ncbi:MAG TPA: hypothetical protein VLS89_13005, partial [Candidatus Nanopelagicales bacterium]|nr:hypothetical protein [Candidatus Nanopelagicales bacterium]
GYQLCTTSELRPNDADIMAFGTTQISVPANGSQDVTCDLNIPAGISQLTTIAGMPHMHKLGRQISTIRVGSGGDPEVDLGTAEPWDFENQIWTFMETTLSPGDTIRTRCAWDNPTPQNVGFGEDTNDEMCFGFVMYYPKIEIPQWHWMLPSVTSSCNPTQ